MKAIVHDRYGSPDVLELREIEKPTPADGEVLVRVRAASVNPLDWHNLTGTPYVIRVGSGLRRPKTTRLGVDFAGTVEAVGADVTRFRPGDEVFGGRTGAFGQYVCVSADRAVAPRPRQLSFEDAAAVPVAALTALEGLRDNGQLRPGQKVLVNGASGGVGTFAVQIAKALGAEVTGVCSTRNLEQARSLGADAVVDYSREDFTLSGQRYDLLLDIAGNRSWADYRRVLEPDARLVVVGGPKTNAWIGPLGHVLGLRRAARRSSQKIVTFMADMRQEDLETLRELIEAGQLKPVVERSYDLNDVPDALRYVAEGHCRGKVAVSI